jgi:glutathione synthase/RimK-type ligase-like ATP-grasp enzyme
MQSKINLVILGNEDPDDHLLWIKACEKAEVNYRVVDLSKDDWLEQVQKEKFDYLLAKPPGLITKFKELYDERIYILERTLNYKIYPSAEEIFIYENKRFLAAWLNANKIPHPETYIFYNKTDAFEFLDKTKFPVIGKSNIGASGSGVHILKNKSQATEYTESIFSGKGAKQRVGPNFKKGNIFKRGLNYIFNPSQIKKKLKLYKGIYNNKQSDFVIFQEFVQHEFEWRVVRIGDSFFAHKKMVKDEKASGSLIKGYENPPLDLIDFVKQITDKYKLFSQAVDVFEFNGNYLVNEMQCIFGQSDAYQMKVDGVIGRYINQNGKWIFEAGDFNSNASYDLRLKWILGKLNESSIR